jgi:ABC-type phosphate transport system substrate-binding protein
MRGEALVVGPLSFGIDLGQFLTEVAVGYALLLLGVYVQAIVRPLISWTVLFNGPTDQRAPEMWQTTWDRVQITPASLVVLEIAGSGFSNTAVDSWELPLSFPFDGRRVIHFKVRDSDDFHRLVKPPPYDEDTPESAKAKIIGNMIVLPGIPLKRREKFKLLVLLEGTQTDVKAGGRLSSGTIKERGGHRLRNQVSAIGAATVIALGLTFFAVLGGGTAQSPTCVGGSLAIEGSTAFAPIAASVDHQYESYCTATSFTLSAIGSSQGVLALEKSRDPDTIAMSDGPYSGDTSGLKAYRVGLVFFAVVADKGTGLNNLTTSELRDIFTMHPATYVAVGRPNGSGTRATFEEKVLGSERKPFPSAASCPSSTQDVVLSPTACTKTTTMDLLTYINMVPNAIGYAEADALPFFPNVNIVSIDGHLPTRDLVKAGQYPFVATEYLYTVQQPSDLTSSFIEYLTGSAVTAQLRDRNFIACSDLSSGVCPSR